jgi:hypothetical protein
MCKRRQETDNNSSSKAKARRNAGLLLWGNWPSRPCASRSRSRWSRIKCLRLIFAECFLRKHSPTHRSRRRFERLRGLGRVFEFVDKVGKLLGDSRTEILEHNSGTAPGAKDSNDARYAELHLARDKADLDVGSPLKTDGRRCDEASGEAKVEDTAPKQKAPVREKHLGLALAAVAFMAATIRFRVLSRLSVVFHSWAEVAIKTYRQGSSRDDEKNAQYGGCNEKGPRRSGPLY